VGFVVDKAALGKVFSDYFGFPCQSSFHQFFIIMITRGWHNRTIGGRSAAWIQMDSTPYTNLKKKIVGTLTYLEPKWFLLIVFHNGIVLIFKI
jgi:hypothetical protein